MASDITTTERSRRGLLTAAAAATAAAVAASVARVVPSSAADGEGAILGVENESESTTTFHSEDAWGLSGTSTNSRGLNGKSEAGQGVHGESTHSAGVSGKSSEGNGVHGSSRDNRGVWGESAHGPGLEGVSDNNAGVKAAGATGVLATSDAGFAVHTTNGRLRFDGISGIVVLPADKTEVEIETDVPVNQNTFVLLSPQANLGRKGLWYQIPEDTGVITVRISESRPKDSRIAYLILEHGPQA